MNTKLQRRVATATAFAATGILATSIAVAAWTSTGSGTGTAASTTSEDSEITAVSSPADLYPGAVSTITVKIDNPNDYPVIVTSISGGSSELENTSCAAGSVYTDARSDINGLEQSGVTTTIIAPQSEANYDLVSRMINNPDDACKAQTFDMDLTATLESAANTSGNN